MDTVSALASARSAILVGMLGLGLSGCGAIGKELLRPVHGDPSVQVIIKTDPSGAKVMVDGKELGTSPVSFRDPSGDQKSLTLEIRKDGYEPVIRSINRQWDSMRLTYRLDPVYFYSLYPLPDSVAKSGRPPAGSSEVVSDVDEVPKAVARMKDRDAVALVIGISKYREDMIPQVKYARRDAEIVASYLEAVGGISRARMKVLTDERATLSDVAAYVEEWLPRRVSSETTVFVYYAGHGVPHPATGKAFLLPYDGHPDFSNKLYPLERLYQRLDQLPAKEVVVMLDSCFSGASGRSVLPHGSRPVGLAVENLSLTSEKLAVLAAATGMQISSDYDQQQHGLFTYYLLKGMRGDADKDSNGTVEVEELFGYVKKGVMTVAAEELNRDQTPVLHPSPEQIGRRGKIRLTAASQ